MAYNAIASLVLQFDDLASPAAEAAARKKADDMMKACTSRHAVMEAQITEEWVASFFLKQRSAAYADDGSGNESSHRADD